MSLLTAEQIASMGFAAVGEGARLSARASYYNCAAIRIGSQVRIDDFCILSAGIGGIELGNYIHIAPYSALIGAGAIKLADFCNLSSRVTLYSSSDDYSGTYMTNPMVPPDYTGVITAEVSLARHVIIGSGSVVLPGARLDEGAAIGALSLVTGHCPAFGVYAGVPAKWIKPRARDLLALEQRFRQQLQAESTATPRLAD